MGAYRYEALNQGGKTQKGLMEGDSPRHIKNLLREQGLIPLSVEISNQGGGRRRGQRISSHDRVQIVRQLSSLANAGIPIDESLSTIASETQKNVVRERLLELRSLVLAGHSLARALEMNARDFPEIFQALVAAGEKSGRLGVVLERLADYIEAKEALTRSVLFAMIYPAIVTVVATGIVIFLMTNVVPQVVSVFINNHQTLPLLTQVMIDISDAIRHWGWLMVLSLILVVLVVRWVLRKPAQRMVWHRWLLTLPIIGAAVRGYNTERFASTLAILVNGGVPILMALQGAAKTMGNVYLREDVERSIVLVREGFSLSRALGLNRRFPPTLLQLIRSGETTGRLADMLDRAALIESRSLEGKISGLTALLEPVLILMMGLVVGLIVMAVLMPIMEINQMIH